MLQREFYNNPESLVVLFQLTTTHDDPNLRQLAAVEARSLVGKHWLSIPASQKPGIREQLLRATLGANTNLVRHATARVISAIANFDLPDGEWSTLPSFLIQVASSGNKEERAIGIYILFTILESLGEGFEERFKELFDLFGKTIRDPESAEVRVNTLLALGRIAVHLDAEESMTPVKAFQNIFPAMVAILKDAIDQGNEDQIMQAFEVFQTLLGCDHQLMSPHFKDLITFMNDLAANTELAEDTRVQAISFLMQCVKYRKLKIQSMRIGDKLTRTALHIATELDGTSGDEDDITPARSALGLLDILSQSLPPSQVVVPLLQALGQYFHSENPSYRRAAIMALGMSVEGAPEFISSQIKEIFPMILHLLADPEPQVRQATLQGVARLADDLSEDVGKEHQKLMPLLVKNLASAMQEYKGEESGLNIELMKAAVTAIDAVVSDLDEKDVVSYQSELVPILQKLFKHPDFKIKARTASAIGALAASAGDAFLPYFDDSMHLMQEYVTLKENDDELELRSSVTDAMGEMAASAGPQRFQPYVEPLMRASEESLHLDYPRLKDSAYLFWGAMSKVYGEEFRPFLEGVVKGLTACIEQEEADLEVELGDSAKDLVGQELNLAGRKVKVASATDDDDGDDDIEDIDLDDDAWDLTTVTPLAQEKEIAAEVVGDIITHTKSAYLPYFEKTIELILPLIEHPYEGVRKSAISTLHRAYATLCAIAEESGKMEKWSPGLPLQSQPAAEVKKFGEILMTATLKMWIEEEDSATVADINRNVAENLRFCGPALIADESVLQKVIQVIMDITSRKHPCQEDFGGNEEAQEVMEETSEFDWIVIDTALEVVSGLAAALGESFAGLWKLFQKTLLRFAGSSENIERSTAVGVLSECIIGMGSAVTPYTAAFLRLLIHRLRDEDPQTKSNAAYALGRLIEKSSADAEIVTEYPAILERLEPCLHQEFSRLPDNATGCLSRMILKHHDNIPLGEVLPAIVEILPLREDYEENEPLYRMICQMYKWEDPTIRQLTPSLLPIFQSVLCGDENQLEDERRQELIELVNWLNKMQPGVAPWVEQLG